MVCVYKNININRIMIKIKLKSWKLTKKNIENLEETLRNDKTIKIHTLNYFF